MRKIACLIIPLIGLLAAGCDPRLSTLSSSWIDGIPLDLARRLGAQSVFMDAAEHDRFVAGISHLPLVVASALVMATTQSPHWPKMSEVAATGYQSATRLASQHPRMNRDICLSNGENIVAWIDEFAGEVERLRTLIAEGDLSLEEAVDKARQARNAWIEEHDKES